MVPSHARFSPAPHWYFDRYLPNSVSANRTFPLPLHSPKKTKTNKQQTNKQKQIKTKQLNKTKQKQKKQKQNKTKQNF